MHAANRSAGRMTAASVALLVVGLAACSRDAGQTAPATAPAASAPAPADPPAEATADADRQSAGRDARAGVDPARQRAAQLGLRVDRRRDHRSAQVRRLLAGRL